MKFYLTCFLPTASSGIASNGSAGMNSLVISSESDTEEHGNLARQAKNMAKGVGYSSYQQKGWDVKAYMAAQKEKDKQIELVLEKIYQELKKLHGSHQTSQRNLPDVITGGKLAVNILPQHIFIQFCLAIQMVVLRARMPTMRPGKVRGGSANILPTKLPAPPQPPQQTRRKKVPTPTRGCRRWTR